jgi:hypothetical protein
MSAASDALENDLVDLIFNNNASTLEIGDANGLQPAGTAGNLYVALHTASPGGASPDSSTDQGTNEATYPGYGRVAVARTAGGWTVSGSSASNAAEIAFGQHSGGSPANETMTHYSIGTNAAGDSPTSQVLFTGTLTSSLAVSSGIEPRFAIGQLSISVD